MKALRTLLRFLYFMTLVACLFVWRWASYSLKQLRSKADERVNRAAYALYATSLAMTNENRYGADTAQDFMSLKNELSEAVYQREVAYDATIMDIIRGGKHGQAGFDQECY